MPSTTILKISIPEFFKVNKKFSNFLFILFYIYIKVEIEGRYYLSFD